MILRSAPEDLKMALGQCFWIGINGTTVENPQTQKILQTFQPGGFVLFQRNIESAQQVQRLNTELQNRIPIPLFLAIDQEGGTVERLHKIISHLPPAMALTATGDRHLVRQLHATHARLLRALGFNVNFTPVLDLAWTNAANGLGTRCFSDNPDQVVLFAHEVIRGHEKAGILVCGKHFPGLGDTQLDSHVALPVVTRNWRKLQRYDLVPYRKLLSHLPFIMVNHALYPDRNPKVPASLAPEIVKDFLLRKWNYQGISISDDLIMGAVSTYYNLPEAAEQALLAGNHQFLICKPEGVIEAYQRLLHRVMGDPRLAAAVYQSSNRVLFLKFRYLQNLPVSQISLTAENQKLQELSQKVCDKSITWLQGKPISDLPNRWTAYLPLTRWLSDKQQVFSPIGWSIREIYYPLALSSEEAVFAAAQSTTEWNIVTLANSQLYPGQLTIVEELLAKKKKVLLISGAFPDPVPEGVQGSVACYWTSPEALRRAVLTLTGKRKARGCFPLQKKP